MDFSFTEKKQGTKENYPVEIEWHLILSVSMSFLNIFVNDDIVELTKTVQATEWETRCLS